MERICSPLIRTEDQSSALKKNKKQRILRSVYELSSVYRSPPPTLLVHVCRGRTGLCICPCHTYSKEEACCQDAPIFPASLYRAPTPSPHPMAPKKRGSLPRGMHVCVCVLRGVSANSCFVCACSVFASPQFLLKPNAVSHTVCVQITESLLRGFVEC